MHPSTAPSAGRRLARHAPIIAGLVLANLLAWAWGDAGDASRHVIVVNLSDRPAQGRIPLGWTDLSGTTWRLSDLLNDARFERDGDELGDPGLFVALDPWSSHFVALARSA